MEKKTVLKYARITPQKARRVTRLIVGKRAVEALQLLKFMPYRGAAIIAKLLKSAVANAEQLNEVDTEDMFIKNAYAETGPMMKRLMPRSMGRANIIKKKMSHITIVLS
ncbi:MAG: 50S ribosomal protein L22 [Candidatus Magnetoovum sp. WYHC-5]|nr:50S ribosomal protein L22 [Candidatus Magnetoovum sp. WYHC-5]